VKKKISEVEYEPSGEMESPEMLHMVTKGNYSQN